jgi:8-hydroxy-5-deazaflavin:NADPH oxidoreductase
LDYIRNLKDAQERRGAMKIGVIGTRNIGGTVARKLSAAGHDVRVANSRDLDGGQGFSPMKSARPPLTPARSCRGRRRHCYIDPVPSGSRAPEGLV